MQSIEILEITKYIHAGYTWFVESDESFTMSVHNIEKSTKF